MKVSDVLDRKGRRVETIKPSETIGTLARVLQRRRIGAVVVSENGSLIEGIISERDIAYSLASRRGELPLVRVSALMTRDVVTCSPDDTLSAVAQTMCERHIRHMPVEEEGRLAGMLSIRDVLEFRLSRVEQQGKILQLMLAASD